MIPQRENINLPQAKQWVSSYVDLRPIIEEPSKPSDESSAFSTSMSYKNTSSSTRSSEKEDPAALIEAKLPSLPFTYWQSKAKGKEMTLNSSCAKMPDLLNLRYNALYWQQVVTSNLTIYLYGAYLDIRAKNLDGPSVRLLGMINKLRPRVELYCQLWFENSNQPVISLVTKFQYIFVGKEGGEPGNQPTNNLQPYLLTCPVPRENATGNPTSVSLVEKACDTATTLLKVAHNKLEEGEEKKKFAVCVKGLDIPDDLTVRLAEWIELVAAMGVDKIFVYKYEVHPKVDKLLKHYHNYGKISLRPISLPGLTFEICNPLSNVLLCTLSELCVLVLASKVLNPTCLDFSTSTSPG